MSSLASWRTSAEPTIPLCPATKTRLPLSSNGVLAIGNLVPRNRQIRGHHLLHELRKARLRRPAELLPRLAGIADQKIDFGRAEINGIDADHGLAGFLVDAGLLHALAPPDDAAADFGKRQFDELTHRTRLAGRQHEIVRPIGLQYPVHAHDIILGVTPVALGVEIAEIEHLFEANMP